MMWMTIGLGFDYRPLLRLFFFPVLEILFFLLGSRALVGDWYHSYGFCALAVATQVLGFGEVLEGAGPSNFS